MKRLLPLATILSRIRGHRKTSWSFDRGQESETEIRRDERGRSFFSFFFSSSLSGGKHLITVKGVHVDSKGRFLRGAVTDFMHSCADAAGGFLKTESDTGRGGRHGGREKTGGEAEAALVRSLA